MTRFGWATRLDSGRAVPKSSGLRLWRDSDTTPEALGAGADVWRSRSVPGLVLESGGVGSQWRYVFRLGNTVVEAWNRPIGWPVTFWQVDRKGVPFERCDPEVEVDGVRWDFEIDPSSKDAAYVTVGSERWVLNRVRGLVFRLEHVSAAGSVDFGPSFGVRRSRHSDSATIALACMLQLLRVEQLFSRSVWGRALAMLRRPVSNHVASGDWGRCGTRMTDARTAFKRAGWEPDRAVDPRDEMAALAAVGHPVPAWVEAVLREFSGLVLRFDRGGRSDEIVLSAQEATRHWDPGIVHDYAIRVGSELIPIGHSNHGHLLLLAAPDGRWFGGYDWTLGELGADAFEAIEAIMENRGFRHEY